jgi:AcrR family transcriptional regulator
MQDVASEAGLSLATIYGVVEGKEELLHTIHARRMREFLILVREARDAATTTLDAHRAVLEQSARFFIERPDFLRLCCRDGYAWGSGLTTTETQAKLWEEGVAIPAELFRRGIEEGLYVDEPPLLLARKMLALQQVELADWAEGGMRADPDVVCARLDAQFLRAFCRPRPDGLSFPGRGSEARSESSDSAAD